MLYCGYVNGYAIATIAIHVTSGNQLCLKVHGNPECSPLNKDCIFIQPRAISFLSAAMFVVDFVGLNHIDVWLINV